MNNLLKSFYNGRNEIEFMHRGVIPKHYQEQINKIMRIKGRDDWVYEWDVEHPDDITIIIKMRDCVVAFSVYKIINFKWKDIELTVVTTEETASINAMCLRMLLIGYKHVFENILGLAKQYVFWLSIIENPTVSRFINRIIANEKIWRKSLPCLSQIRDDKVENEIALHYLNNYYAKSSMSLRDHIGPYQIWMENINEIIVVEINNKILTEFGNNITKLTG